MSQAVFPMSHYPPGVNYQLIPMTLNCDSVFLKVCEGSFFSLKEFMGLVKESSYQLDIIFVIYSRYREQVNISADHKNFLFFNGFFTVSYGE